MDPDPDERRMEIEAEAVLMRARHVRRGAWTIEQSALLLGWIGQDVGPKEAAYQAGKPLNAARQMLRDLRGRHCEQRTPSLHPDSPGHQTAEEPSAIARD